MDGILLSHVKAIKVPADWTVRQFKKEFILPKTDRKISYVDYLRLSEDTAALTSEKADVFISYAWDLRFADVIASLPLDDTNPDRFIWMDVFCFKPKAEDAPSSEIFFEHFKQALKEIGRAEIVVMPWNDPLPPKRAWCIFEYSIIIQEEVKYQCRMAPSDRQKFKAYLKKNKTSSTFFKHVFASVNVLSAKADREADRERILSIVRSVGTNVVNDAVKNPLRSWLEGVLNEALEEVRGRGDEDEANVWCAMGFLCSSQGRYDEAAVAFENSGALHRKLSGGMETRNSLAVKSNLGIVLIEQNNLVDAEITLRDVYDKTRALIPAEQDQETMAITASNLANVLRKRSNFDEAEDLYIEAIRLFDRLCIQKNIESGKRSPALEDDPTLKSSGSTKDLTFAQLAVCLNNLGRLYQKLQRPIDAQALYEKALSLDLEHYGDDHIEVAGDMHNLAMALHEQGKSDEASEYGRKALSIYTRVYGENHKMTEPLLRAWGPRKSRAPKGSHN